MSTRWCSTSPLCRRGDVRYHHFVDAVMCDITTSRPSRSGDITTLSTGLKWWYHHYVDTFSGDITTSTRSTGGDITHHCVDKVVISHITASIWWFYWLTSLIFWQNFEHRRKKFFDWYVDICSISKMVERNHSYSTKNRTFLKNFEQISNKNHSFFWCRQPCNLNFLKIEQMFDIEQKCRTFPGLVIILYPNVFLPEKFIYDVYLTI